jgi:CheY-like chemotaxis protein
MEIVCSQCSAKYRAVIAQPLTAAVRAMCPACGKQVVLKPTASSGAAPKPPARPAGPRRAIIADEPRDFRAFLGDELRKLGFEVAFHDTGDSALEAVRRTRAALVVLNVYLKGKLGVEISEEIKKDPTLSATRVVLIGALFRANRFRANPTNLYGADEYIEEQIPALELQSIIQRLFPEIGAAAVEEEPKEFDEARRLARLILSDIIIYNSDRVEQGIREGNFFEILQQEISEGREYYESRVPFRVKQDTEFFNETLQQFVQMKREELAKLLPGSLPS